MIVSLKELISRSEENLGVFAFRTPPKIILKNSKGEIVSAYEDLEEIQLSKDEQQFVNTRWAKIKEENPTFYDGYVTAITDVLYDETDNELTFVMDRTRYSVVSAAREAAYPNHQLTEKYLSFGLGLMTNLELPNSKTLMTQRSSKVFGEKGAISVPGGSLEYKEGKKDDIKSGLEIAALEELEEEILPEITPQQFVINFSSIAYERANGRVGLNAFFHTISKIKPLSKHDIVEGHARAVDRDESTGEFYFFDPSVGGNIKTGNLIKPAALDLIEAKKDGRYLLQNSGTQSMATAIFDHAVDSNSFGVPRMEAVAERFKNVAQGFTIFDITAICSTTPRLEIAPRSDNPAERLALESAKTK